MPFTPEQNLWLSKHLIDTGRARGDGTEEERARREDTLVSEVTERIELSANATYVSEEVVKIIEDGDNLPAVPVVAPVKTDPAYPLLAKHATRPSQPKATDFTNGKKDPAFTAANKEYNDWGAQNSLFEKATQAYDNDVKARRRLVVAAPVKAAAQSRVNDLKTQQPDQYNSLKNEAVRKEETKTGAAFTGDKEALTDKHLTQVYIIDEIDKEISDRIAAHDEKVKMSGTAEDPETRLEGIAEIIAEVGEKYEFTNLAHFISRHGAERVNPDTGEAKRTKSDAVARIATGVGPDQVPKSGSKPATVVTGKVGGEDVEIPEYSQVGGQTAPASSQHASAKAALFMLEEGAAQTSMEEHLAGSDRTNAVNVTVGHETVGDDSFVSFPETGGLGDAYQLKTGSTEVPLGKAGAPDSGDVLPKSKIENLLAEIEQTHDQQSAILTNLPNQVLGGHTPITMFSKDATDASTTYTSPITNKEQTLDKAAALRAKQEGDAIATKAVAEKTLATVMDGDINAKKKQADAEQERDDAKAALDLAITSPVDAPQQLVIDDVALKAQEAVKARIKATAAASMAVKATAMLAEVDIEVKNAQSALAGVKATAAQPNSSGGAVKTTEESQKDALAVQNVEAWVARALARQVQASDIVKEATAAKIAEEKTAIALEAESGEAVKKPGPVPKESLEKVAEHAMAMVKVDAAKEEAAMWSKAAISAQLKVEKAEEVVKGYAVQRVAQEKKVAEEDKLNAAKLEENKAKQEETSAKQKQASAKAAVELAITSPVDPTHQLVIDEVEKMAREAAESEIETERYKALKNPSKQEKEDRTKAFQLLAKLKGDLNEALKKTGPVPADSLKKVAAHAQAKVKTGAATIEVSKKTLAVADAQIKVDTAEAQVREVTDEDAILAAELAAERRAKDTKAKDLANVGGETARKNLAAFEAEELKAIDESEARSDPKAKVDADLKRYQEEFETAEATLTKDKEALAAVMGEPGEATATEKVEKQAKVVASAAKRLKTAGKDAAAVEKTLSAEAAARAAVQDKAIKRAKAEVRNRAAAALASAPDASSDEIKEAAKAKARFDFADAEVRLAETQQSVDRARVRVVKANDARDKAVAAMSGKALNTSQTEFLANVERRATEAQRIADELEKVGGPLKLAEQEVIAMKQALGIAENA